MVYSSAIILGLCLSLMALGIFISMKVFNIPDISTDGTYTLGAVITAVCLTQGYPLLLTWVLAAIGGMIAGSITGFIHTKLKVNALLAGILVMTALYSVNLSILGRSNLPLLNTDSIFQSIRLVGDDNRNDLLLLGIIVSVFWFGLTRLFQTDFGLAMRATGQAEAMVRAMGVNTDRMKIIGLAMANGLTATAGFLITQYQGFADISMGIGIVIVGLGSVMIAEAVQHWFAWNDTWLQLLLVIAGAILFQLVLALCLGLGVNPNFLKLFTAVFVLVIVALPKWKRGNAG